MEVEREWTNGYLPMGYKGMMLPDTEMMQVEVVPEAVVVMVECLFDIRKLGGWFEESDRAEGRERLLRGD
jgi:hypothetical protein